VRQFVFYHQLATGGTYSLKCDAKRMKDGLPEIYCTQVSWGCWGPHLWARVAAGQQQKVQVGGACGLEARSGGGKAHAGAPPHGCCLG
jgi:hypothetical protein